MKIDLKKYRLKAGLTQVQLAQRVDLKLSRQNINNIEAGRNGASIERWTKILDALGYELQVIKKKNKK